MTICAIAKHNANDTRTRTVKQQRTRFVFMRKLSNSYWVVSLHTHSVCNCDAKLDLMGKMLKSKNTPYSKLQNTPQLKLELLVEDLQTSSLTSPEYAPQYELLRRTWKLCVTSPEYPPLPPPPMELLMEDFLWWTGLINIAIRFTSGLFE